MRFVQMDSVREIQSERLSPTDPAGDDQVRDGRLRRVLACVTAM